MNRYQRGEGTFSQKHDIRKIRPVVVVSLISIIALAVSTVNAENTVTIAGEVFESAGPIQLNGSRLNSLRFSLLRHANAADRQKLSEWLKRHRQAGVQFVVDGSKYNGVLCRLAYCFGRGLLLYDADITIRKNAIINLVLPWP